MNANILEDRIAEKFCQIVIENPDMSNATVRIGAWLIGAAKKTGGFPLELSIRQINNGFIRRGKKVEGARSRMLTIQEALRWWEDNGYISVKDGRVVTGGSHAKIISFDV